MWITRSNNLQESSLFHCHIQKYIRRICLDHKHFRFESNGHNIWMWISQKLRGLQLKFMVVSWSYVSSLYPSLLFLSALILKYIVKKVLTFSNLQVLMFIRALVSLYVYHSVFCIYTYSLLLSIMKEHFWSVLERRNIYYRLCW